MSGSGFDYRGGSRRVSIPKEFCVATPEELVKRYGGSKSQVINKVNVLYFSNCLCIINSSSDDKII